MHRTKLTKDFYVDEFERSETAARYGINITIIPKSDIYVNVLHLCRSILQPIRDDLGVVTLLSGWRPPKVNRLVGGSRTSEHLDALAADIFISSMPLIDAALLIEGSSLPFQTLIYEFGRWIHISAPAPGMEPERKVLTANKYLGKTTYVAGIHRIEELTGRAA